MCKFTLYTNFQVNLEVNSLNGMNLPHVAKRCLHRFDIICLIEQSKWQINLYEVWKLENWSSQSIIHWNEPIHILFEPQIQIKLPNLFVN